MSWKVLYLGINLLGVDSFIALYYYVICIILLRNLSHNQSLSNSFFFPFILFLPLPFGYNQDFGLSRG